MDENELFRQWEIGKRSRNFRRLREPIVIAYDHRRQFGHPSSFASVRIEATPADRFSVQFSASWPASVRPEEARYFESAIAEGLIDTLFTTIEPYRGCSVTVVEVQYDTVGSSFAAFQIAATKAAERLVHDGSWEMVVHRGASS